MGLHKTASALAIAWVLCGCSAPAVEQRTAPLELPAQWSQASAGDEVSERWWQSFGSAELDAVIDQARRQSWDVAAAVARVNQAAAQTRQATAGLSPQLTGSLNAQREGRLAGAAQVTGNRAVVTLSASYELDFWAKNRAAQEAAQASLQASRFARDTVQLTVTAGVANAWLSAVALSERVDIAQQNVQSAERLLQLLESRARLGAAFALELAQQRGLVASQRRALAALQQQMADAQSALALLLGQTSSVAIAQSSLLTLQAPSVELGVPAQLLTRRPDIARAEAQLLAADANVRAARAAMLPRLTFTADVTAGEDRWQRIFASPIYSLAAGLAAPIFDAGRLAAGRDLALAQREELLAAYRQSIVQAFADVQTALNALAGIDAQALSQAEELAQARRALALAEVRYRAGAETLLTLLDTQRSLYAAQDMTVQLQLARLQAHVALYKALGGGWLGRESQSDLL